MGNGFFSNWIVKNILWAVIVFAILIFGVNIALGIITEHGKVIEVPDFTNLSVPEAEKLAASAGLRVEVTDSIFVPRMQKGAVKVQNPAAGIQVKNNRKIRLTINATQSKKITMPDLVGLSMRQARAELSSKGLNLGRIIYVNDMATNNVLKQLYKNVEIKSGAPVISGSDVDLVVGLNENDCVTNVPDLTGMRYQRAIDAAHDNSLNIGRLRFDDVVKTYADSLNAIVYKQSPAGSDNICRMGSEVTLYLTLPE